MTLDQAIPGILFADGPPIPVLPFKPDTVAVFGHVIGRQSHLTEDRCTIYTEYQLTIQETFYDKQGQVPAGSKITVLTRGGAVRLPNGRVLRLATRPNQHMRVGGRYVLFLTSRGRPTVEGFSTLRLWQIKNGLVVPPAGNSSFAGWDETRFLTEVREAGRRALETTETATPKAQEGRK